MSVIMTLKITYSNVYQAPPGTQQSRITNLDHHIEDVKAEEVQCC